MMQHFSIWDFAKYRGFPFSINIGVHITDFDVHVHTYSELCIVFEGTADHIVDGQRYELKAGDVFVITGHTQHGFHNIRAMKHCNIMFDNGALLERDDGLRQLPGYQALFRLEPYFRKDHKFRSKLVLDPARIALVEDIIHLMLDEYNHFQSGSEAVIKAYFLTLIAYLSRQYSWEGNPALGKLQSLSKAVAYMETNFVATMNLEALASMAYLSVRHFTRVFKEIYKVSPMEYISWLRLQHSRELLENSALPVSQVAADSGFSSISYFSRQFKAKYGVSPKDYRSLVRHHHISRH